MKVTMGILDCGLFSPALDGSKPPHRPTECSGQVLWELSQTYDWLNPENIPSFRHISRSLTHTVKSKANITEAKVMLHSKPFGRHIGANLASSGRLLRLALSCTYAIKCKHVSSSTTSCFTGEVFGSFYKPRCRQCLFFWCGPQMSKIYIRCVLVISPSLLLLIVVVVVVLLLLC